MIETIPSPPGELRPGYVLLALLSAESQQRITDVTEKLKQEFPATLWCVPPSALHVTLCEIVQPKQYEAGNDELFERNRSGYEEISGNVISQFGRFTVSFDSLEASPGAVIVRGEDDGSFDRMRAQLAEQLPFPEGTKLPPKIIHSTIARYSAAADLAPIQAAVSRHQIAFEEAITGFKLVRFDTQPMLKYDTIQTYDLAA